MMKVSPLIGLLFTLLIVNGIFLMIYVNFDSSHWNGIEENDKTTMLEKIGTRVYFILTSISTAGYGDISPKSQKARAVVSLHLVFVTINLFTILAKLISRRECDPCLYEINRKN